MGNRKLSKTFAMFASDERLGEMVPQVAGGHDKRIDIIIVIVMNVRRLLSLMGKLPISLSSVFDYPRNYFLICQCLLKRLLSAICTDFNGQ